MSYINQFAFRTRNFHSKNRMRFALRRNYFDGPEEIIFQQVTGQVKGVFGGKWGYGVPAGSLPVPMIFCRNKSSIVHF